MRFGCEEVMRRAIVGRVVWLHMECERACFTDDERSKDIEAGHSSVRGWKSAVFTVLDTLGEIHESEDYIPPFSGYGLDCPLPVAPERLPLLQARLEIHTNNTIDDPILRGFYGHL